MTEFTMPFVRDLVTARSRPAAPRVASDDLVAGTATPISAPRPLTGSWLRPLADLFGVVLLVLGGQTIGHGLDPRVAVALVLLWPLALATSGAYARRPVPEGTGVRLGRVVRSGAKLGLVSWLLVPLLGASLAPSLLVPAVTALTAWSMAVTAVTLGRATTRVVVVGGWDDVRTCVTELMTQPTYDVAAACVAHLPEGGVDEVAGRRVPVHAGIAGAVDVARESRADAVLLLPGVDLSNAQLRRLQWQAPSAGLHVYVATGLLDVDPARLSVVQGAGLDLLHVRHASLRGPRLVLKGLADRLFATLGLLLLTPLLLAVVALIKSDTPGSAIFRQTRVGRDGRHFTMYKFRTMSITAETDKTALVDVNECDDVLFKVREDPRITQVGRVLRRYSVDELPQLWNVVVGDMSLVGPRPALPQEVAQYEFDPRRRLAVKPGLTGLWQVSGRSDLSWAESVRLDVRYVDNWSMAHDLTILGRTAGAVLGHRGAY